MNNRQRVQLAWALFGLVALSSIISASSLLYQEATRPLKLAGDLLAALGVPLMFAGVGALIVVRLPRNSIGWLLLTPALASAVFGPIGAYLQSIAAALPPPTPLLLLLVWLDSWSWLPLILPPLLMAQLFPSGRPLSPRWRWAVAAVLGWAVLLVTVLAVSSTIVDPFRTPVIRLANPIGVLDWTFVEQWINAVWAPGLLALTVLSVAALVVRFRRADAVERQQIQWLLYACALFAALRVVGGVAGVGGSDTPVGDVYYLLFSLGVLTIPAAIGIAILRYRLFDIDVIIRRTLVYAVLTVALGAVYLASVVALQALFVWLTGQVSTLAVVASTLAIAGLFQPLRRRVQALIDRRFFRRRYDARLVLEQFATRAQQEADLDALSADILGVVQETLEPETARLWLVRR